MVSSNIVSQFQGPPMPPFAGGDRKITIRGPLYDVGNLLKNIREIGISPWTRKCRSDVNNLAFDEEDLRLLLEQTLLNGGYIDSEWCQQSSKENSPWAACDAYKLERQESFPKANGVMNVQYFLKFSLAKTGNMILTISCHVSS